MNRYKLIISYDGTDYYGWQEQAELKTICGTLQSTFKKVFGESVTVLGASRTDAGVHALGQVALLRTAISIPADKLRWAWNNALPPDIVIRSLIAAPENFHPFYNVAQKTYHYHFFVERPLPFVQRYGWFYRAGIDIDKLSEVLLLFQGTHDFRSFCTGDEMGENTVRTIDSISLEYVQKYGAYRITVKAKAFLRHMIRRVVGAGLAVAARSDWDVTLVKKVLAAKDANNELPTAAAQGLLLYNIVYNE